MKARTLTLASVALVVALGVFGTWRWAQATGPDVNNDGTVNIIDIGLVVQSFMQQVPTPTPPPPPPTPNPSNDVLVADDVLLPRGLAALGSYEPDLCEDAVIFIGASGFETVGFPAYDFLIAASDDGLTPRDGEWSNIGNSSPVGLLGEWVTTRKTSRSENGKGPWKFVEPPNGEPAQYVLIGVFSNPIGGARYVVEVHCTRTYPE